MTLKHMGFGALTSQAVENPSITFYFPKTWVAIAYCWLEAVLVTNSPLAYILYVIYVSADILCIPECLTFS